VLTLNTSKIHPFHPQSDSLIWQSLATSTGQVDLYTLQKLLTHKNPAMTQRYAHLRDQALRQAADLAGDIIDKITKG
jgi:integrase